jgi:hypothetical protein
MYGCTLRLIETSGFKDFVPRSQHAMAYDPVKDMVYIIGGTSLNTLAMWDMITYTFGKKASRRRQAVECCDKEACC